MHVERRKRPSLFGFLGFAGAVCGLRSARALESASKLDALQTLARDSSPVACLSGIDKGCDKVGDKG